MDTSRWPNDGAVVQMEPCDVDSGMTLPWAQPDNLGFVWVYFPTITTQPSVDCCNAAKHTSDSGGRFLSSAMHIELLVICIAMNVDAKRIRNTDYVSGVEGEHYRS